MKIFIILSLALIYLTGLNHIVPTSLLKQLQYRSLPSKQDLTINKIDHKAVAIPIKVNDSNISISAKSIYAVDRTTGQVLYNLSADTPLPIASITKLITAMVILQTHQLNETVEIPTLPIYRIEDEKIGIVTGEKILLKDLLKATLIASGNDAADALAIYDSGSISKFSNKMNNLISSWGITNTHFNNANGLIDNDNYASAQSLARIGMLALNNNFIAETVKTMKTTVYNLAGKPYVLYSTNQLLVDPSYLGIKTGYTPAAGQSLLALVRVNDHQIITVILGSNDRFNDTSKLVIAIRNNWLWL